jgi:4-hydroxy-tetrahydrodipicolinate synthase
MNRVPFRGVVPAALTPFDTDYEVDRREFRRHIESLSAVRGITAIMVNGAAGQDTSLSRDERRSLVAEAASCAGDYTPIIVALRESESITLESLARDAETEGANALLLMPPAAENEAMDKARARLNRVIEASALPVAIYQVRYTTETLTRLAELSPVFAVKEGSGDPALFERNMRALHGLGRGVAVWSTNSCWLLADLAMGADGILSGMGSVAANLHSDLAEAVWRSDLASARRINDHLFPLTQVFYRPGRDPHTRMKYALTRLGRWSCGYVRPPFEPLDDEERARIDQALRASALLADDR